jgi:flagella basal body P-ring formation protein FlgA
MRMILMASVSAALAHADCVAVSSERILARDVREALPFLQELNPETPIGFSPRPGVQRILSVKELILIAQKHGLVLSGNTISSVCVERLVRPIAPEEMRAALLSAIGVTDVELEVVEFSREPLPPGRLEFRPANLGRPFAENLDNPVAWRGLLHYDAQSSVPVWAKVKVSVGSTLLVAAEDIPAGTVIKTVQVKEVNGRQFPFRPLAIQSPQAIIGKIARHSISAGQKFAPGALDDPTEIARGDKVRVRVLDGSAILSLDAVAQSSGKKGESILVRNPSTGKNFRAVVEDKGRVTLRSSPGV